MYYNDIFYKFDPLLFEDIVQWGLDNSYITHVDIINDGSLRREKTDYSPEYYMDKRKDSSFIHDVVIYRRGYDNWTNKDFFPTNWCIEIGSCTVNLFIFIYVKEDKLEELINKFNLVV